MKNYLGYFCILFVLLGVVAACAQQAPQQKPEFTPEELLQIEEHQFSKLCSEMRTRVSGLSILSLDVASNSWPMLAEVCVKTYDPIAKYTLIPTLLPTKKDAEPLVMQCDICLDYASKIINNSPYERSYSTSGKIEKMTLSQWVELCKTFQTGIYKVISVADAIKLRAINKFDIVELGFKNSHQTVQDEFFNKFQVEKGKYLKSIEDIKLGLGQTQVLLTKLIEWKFNLADTSSPLQDEFLKRFPTEKKLVLMPFGEVQFEQEQDKVILLDFVKKGFDIYRSPTPSLR